MPSVDLPALIRESVASPQWEDVAGRCLTCANCTMVCPTCSCTTTEEVSDLTGDHAERWQRWASCFELDFSFMHGGSVRQSGGNAAQVLIDAAADADLLVVGSRGHGVFTEALLGSVSQQCVQHARCPVVIVRDHNGGLG
jgi:coenzyme F420-reducing hydrogenase beta subunit